MKIRDIQIDGFGVWSGLSVDSLPSTMTVFYGPNEAGKTTLMQFLRAMFYGFTPERRMRYMPPVYGGKPGGAIRVSGPGGGYEISRRSQLDAETTTGHLTVTSSDGVSQGQHRLSTLLGNVDEPIFSNVFAIGLRELQELNTLDDTSAADELYKLSSGMDRVSLVDVIRKLKTARGQVVGPNPDVGQLQSIMLRREKLKQELEQLNNRSRRWGELASVRKSQQKEIAELRARVETLTLEARTVELSLQVRDPWKQRTELTANVQSLNARDDLPDDAEDRLKQLKAQIDEKRVQIDELKSKRRDIRESASALPLNKAVIALATKIDVANEQGPWIASLQKQIHQLDSQVEQAREQLLQDAKRLGLSEEDQAAILNDKRMASMPDLSPQAISQLMGPAKDVKSHYTNLKQAKTQIRNDKKESAKLGEKIKLMLDARSQPDLQTALSKQEILMTNLRKLQQVEERLDKLVKHRKELEGEAVDLASNEALPMDRIVPLGIPFVLGGTLFAVGGISLLGFQLISFSSGTSTMMCVFGMMLLLGWYMWLQLDQRTTNVDLNDCEGQLDGLVAQIRKTQAERDEIQKLLPEHGGAVEQRIRESESELSNLETLLPVSHNYEAVQQRLRSANKDAVEANDGLRAARSLWKRTLQNLGLAESLSPKSIRMMAEGYESLTQSRRRVKTLEDELEQRHLELAAIDAKIDSILRQILSVQGAKAITNELRNKQQPSNIDSNRNAREQKSGPVLKQSDSRSNDSKYRNQTNEAAPQAVQQHSLSSEVVGYDTGDSPVEKLSKLQAIIAGQQQFIVRKRELKFEFDDLIKKHKTIRKSMERIVRGRDALLAELAVEDSDQLSMLLGKKREAQKLNSKIDDCNGRIQAALGGHVPYETVARLLENAQSANDLEKRWDVINQHIQQAENRVSTLLEKQGETQQEMKSIAGDRRLLELKTELSVLDKQLTLTAEHWRTLATTHCMLQRVCEIYETERQPETLREASAFLKQLTDGKYRRVWTPLGKNALRVENDNGQDLPIEVLSRGTREAVFIALRLSLAAAYSRRGIMLPLVLDDVLVNFDSDRAYHAAKVLRDFSQLGHQTIFFTCHEHIMRMFHEIDVQVRVLPPQGQSGEAKIYAPPAAQTFFANEIAEDESYEDSPEQVEPVEIVTETINEEQDVVPEEETVEEEFVEAEPAYAQANEMPELEQTITEAEDSQDDSQIVVETTQYVMPPKPKARKTVRKVRSQPRPFRREMVQGEVVAEKSPSLDHLWYERQIENAEPTAYEDTYEAISQELAEQDGDRLNSDNTPGVAWDWDTTEVRPVTNQAGLWWKP